MIPTLNFFCYRAKLIAVVDGDTADLLVDLGFHVTVSLRFRLFGVDAPEKRGAASVAGKAAQDALEALLRGANEIVVETMKDKTEKYGRFLARIYVRPVAGAPWIDVNAVMIEQGHATAYEGGAR
jgi:micrococcal nuclease